MSFFKNLLRILAIILVIIALIYAVTAALAYLGTGVVSGAGVEFITLGLASELTTATALWIMAGALALAAILSPEGFSQAIEAVAAGAGTIISAAAIAATSVFDPIIDWVKDNPIFAIGIAAGAAYLLFGGSDDNLRQRQRVDGVRSTSVGSGQSVEFDRGSATRQLSA